MKHKTILITGATGFLGSYIARELSEAGFHLKLLVRRKSTIRAKERLSETFPSYGTTESAFHLLQKQNHLEIIEGDVSKNNFELDMVNYLRLAETVDEVFHCAAATKFDDDISDVHTRTNVFGTELIALFCITRKLKRLHYISTAYVAGRRRETILENELEKKQLFNNNYERSKYTAERIISIFARHYQIPYTIYRPSIITGDATTGYTKNYDNIYVFGKGLSHLKNYEMRDRRKGNDRTNSGNENHFLSLKVPGDKYGTINLIPVDYAARSIVTISRNEESLNKTFHIVNPSPPTLGELAEWMRVATGVHHVKLIPMHEFQAQQHTLQEKLFFHWTKAFQPYMFGEPNFDSTGTRNLLRGTGIECPLITQELINRFLQYAIDTNWGNQGQAAANIHFDDMSVINSDNTLNSIN